MVVMDQVLKKKHNNIIQMYKKTESIDRGRIQTNLRTADLKREGIGLDMMRLGL